MSDFPGQFSTAQPGPQGVYRTWLQAQANESGLAALSPSGTRASEDAHAFGPVRVLVADDNPVNLMVISALLESRGLLPLLAADGAEAVALACAMPFDLILMDLQMPVLDGLGATSAIRRFEAAHGHTAVPVIAFSCACPGPAVLAGHGLNGSLEKPCSARELEDCLAQWCPAFCPAPAGHGTAPLNGRGLAARQSSRAGSSVSR